MEERNKESLAFSVRVRTLQEEEMVEEEHRETAKEVKIKEDPGLDFRRFYYQALAQALVI